MTIIGIILVILTFYAIVKKYETRLVLMFSGLLMAVIGGTPEIAINAFIKELVDPSLTPIICLTMGFSFIIDATNCSNSLISIITSWLKKAKPILIPATVILVWFMNVALISASGLAAAVGAILIPTLIRAGIHPAMAASAVLLGTWGSSVSPGNPFIAQVAQLADTDVMSIIIPTAPKLFICVIITSVILTLTAYLKKENFSSENTYVKDDHKISNTTKINYFYATIPLIPIVLLIISSPIVGWIPQVSIPIAMLFGTVLCLIVTRPNIKNFANFYFKGLGTGFSDIVCLIAAAAVFIQGMDSIGLTSALIDGMRNSASIAKVSAVFGPFFLAAISGSGNAAVLAFNGTVTPHAAAFNLNIADMGSAVQAAAMLGRCLSPVAGVSIICAKLANVNPMDLTKRNAIPCIIGGIAMIILILL
ncbi:C4-dicarboxylate transporter DcuC [Pectinatus frisingensis]|uniref:C4-dicarboxylate transporter DcuC n=1 Tax=Pectinatus frisingensis TaxID=865 RepID=UPI0018C63146|nr:C4-dicarboxylate transporter DcuC [Pectinatus frisingensis]